LACQTVVEKDIFLVQLPYVPAHKATYDIGSIRHTEDEVVDLYPELLRCMGCNTCTRSCPMNLEVMNYVSAAICGDWETVKELSMECIMCGMCAARCPAELAPFNIAMLIRRMVGKRGNQTPPQFKRRLDDIESGSYQAEIERIQQMNSEALMALYKEFQSSKGDAV
jgi:heterodisulfide reductase subunit C